MTVFGCRDARLGSGFWSLFPFFSSKQKKRNGKITYRYTVTKNTGIPWCPYTKFNPLPAGTRHRRTVSTFPLLYPLNAPCRIERPLAADSRRPLVTVALCADSCADICVTTAVYLTRAVRGRNEISQILKGPLPTVSTPNFSIWLRGRPCCDKITIGK